MDIGRSMFIVRWGHAMFTPMRIAGREAIFDFLPEKLLTFQNVDMIACNICSKLLHAYNQTDYIHDVNPLMFKKFPIVLSIKKSFL